jgi:hypothetical protein
MSDENKGLPADAAQAGDAPLMTDRRAVLRGAATL